MNVSRKAVRTLVALAVAGAVAALVGSDLLAARTTTKNLGGANRFLTHVSTDKPIYRPGEKVYIRGVVLNARDHTPMPAKERAQAMIQIKGPKGDVVGSGTVATQDSVLAFHWPVPKGQAGGEYTILVTYPWNGHAPAERKFDIRAYRPPRLKSQIVFLRDGYGPGDKVTATVHVERAEGGLPEGAKVTALPRVDGAQVARAVGAVDAKGNCTVSFKLPDKIERGEGTLAMVIEDGGVVETAAKTIPILLQTIDLTLYPEGGELVAGLPTRVYLEARTPAKKPADIAGEVIETKVVGDAPGATASLEAAPVATFRTEHEGRGRFAFTPRKGSRYTLKITEPAGIKTVYPLPTVRTSGAVVRSIEDITARGQAVRLRAASTAGGKLTVTLATREVEVSSATWDATPGVLADVVLTPPRNADGVLVATLWDEKGTPLAERLIYREPAKTIQIAVKAQKPSYVPGERAKITVKATDEAGKPVAAVVGLTVTDDSVLEMIETREQAPRLPVMVLIESEVRELADAHVYLDKSDPEAPRATDLLLGTQGWRRFAFVDTATFIAKHGNGARRVLALRMATRRERFAGIAKGRGGRQNGILAPGGAPMDGAGALALGRPEAPAEGAPPPQPKVAAKPMAPPKMARPADRADALAKLPKKDADRKQLVAALVKAEALLEEKELLADEARRPLQARGRLRRSEMVAVRLYAHKVRPGRKPADRVDFTETLYWNAGVRTDPKTGEASVEFGLSDSVTTFRVFADAFGADGALGQGTGAVESVEPFYIEPKFPLEVTSGDVVQLPISLVNGIESGLIGTRLTFKTDGELQVGEVKPFALDPKARERKLVNIRVGHLNGAADFVVSAVSGPYADKVTRKLTVVPLGFPVERAFGGMTATNGSVSHTVVVPQSVVPRSITTSVAVYPTPLANLTEALERLIRDPHGCFEQTSSTTYPLVMAQQYFLTHAGVDPAVIERARGKLDAGYKRLTSFECKQRGYEWFGGDPGHEALTAYGLLEFTDMAQVRDVNQEMIQRTRKWLLDRRDGKGGFKRNKRALDSFGRAPDETTNAYSVWALLESGQKGLDPEIAAIKKNALAAKDSYVVALAANVLALAKDDAGAKQLMDKLVKSQAKDGSVAGAVTSITRSGGQALLIETTSLAILAWLRQPAYAGSVEKAMQFVAESCKAGRFGSTQSTVLALRAIVTYDKLRARPKNPGTVRVVVDGQPVGDPVPFDKDTKGAIKLPDIAELLSPGKHQIELRMGDGSAMPYSMAVSFHNVVPDSAKDCKLDLKVALSEARVAEGAVTEANVTVTNRADEAVPMTVAIVGIPGGLEPRHDQLKELVKAGTIAAYEVIGRDVVLYWRQLTAKQKVELPISCVAAVPGTYTGPASRAYLYYTDELKTWAGGLKAAITPRAQD